MRVSPDLTRIGGETRSSRALFVVPLAIILAVTLTDLTTPPTVHLGPFLIAAPAITASFAGAGGTAVVGALAVGAQIIIGAFHGGLMTANHQAQIIALIVISGLVTSFRYATDRHRRRLSQVRSVAVAAQEVLLRPLPERIGELRIASLYLAADEEAQIGGDLYAAVRTERATRLVIGDVRGKGLAAIGDAAVLIGAFRGSAYRNLSLPGIAVHMGSAMCWNWHHIADDERNYLESFVTAVVLDVHDDGPVAGMVNCGHPPPLLLHRGEIATLDVGEPAVPLGLEVPKERDYQVETFRFQHGDLLVLHTDGVVEARNESGAFYPLRERLAVWRGGDPQSLVDHLHADLLRHTGGVVNDDAAIVVIARCA
ncbi:PP2C family protein-serine/threonine phosphatase [Streptomyces rapamycinicus]|uniref:Protein phosphatase n=2 Tax=Streptomyces rapamycinicus TaxID=1226757 RepID=A0A0A0NIC6_STRRN|nr:PP2C family protein-serine/threonine phosphatase [Streptomyces rapamycinicus]AGP54160.1 protein phosphatase [Streptomyces rapamycinicus NRRL 5491]MBB4781661.1 serine phosphatase RsbU (regulator of sigma subunit) [Streptomyces rapamycinicus]RLV73697.1 protein phosphatase [Streptomyces rapamycinicus NRRL 5491]UTO62242.1 serine/threonine-protein phosphatase [Streptomyces rapamycinicus]UTP30196.1 serine/threonine-protein phosphatase [Streptomyces rapamycinicus NRRL 5491]